MSFPKLLFITPPFTQFNTPYPATAYLKGYFGTLNVPCSQADLSLETILKMCIRDRCSMMVPVFIITGQIYTIPEQGR